MDHSIKFKELLEKFVELDDWQSENKDAVIRGVINSQAHLRTLIEIIPDLIWLKDQDGVFLACNKKFERLYGAKEEEIIGKTDYDFVERSQADFFCNRDRQAIEKGSPLVFEERVTFLDDGHEELLETIKTPMYDPKGNLIGTLGISRDITERKRIEEALQLSEERLQTSLKIANIGVWDWNVSEDTWYASPVYYTMLGYEPVSGPSDREKWIARVHPEDREMVLNKIHSILDFRTKEYRYEARMKHADGTYRWHLVIGHVLKRDKDDKPAHLLGLRIDITERKITELALEARQREFELLYRLSEIELKEISLKKMLDAIVRELAKALDFQTISIAYYHRSEQAIETAAVTGPSNAFGEIGARVPAAGTLEGTVVRTGQPQIDASLSKRSAPVFDRLNAMGFQTVAGFPLFMGETVIGVLSMASPQKMRIDPLMIKNLANFIASLIGHKRATEERLLNHRRTRILLRLGQMTDVGLGEITDFALKAAVDLTQSKIGYLAFLNEAETILTVYSWSKSALRDCRIRDNRKRKYSVSDTGLWGETVRQRRPIIINDYAGDIPWKKGLPQGHIPLLRHMGVPTFSGDRIVVVAGVANKKEPYTETDIQQVSLLMQGMWQLIERRQAEKEREKLQAQLTQAQKMEAVGRLAGGVAHDFNNMLGVIIGHTDLLLTQTGPDQPIFSALKNIRKAADRSADLTRQLLAFARKQPIAPKVLDLNSVVESMLEMLTRLIGEDIHLSWFPSSGLHPVMMDPGQVDQILVNLCVNARDAIEGTGKITIESRNVHFDDRYCSEHAGFVPGVYVMLAVSDNGSGMDKAVLDNIFEPFFTTKPDDKGTGLGLAMIYGIVKQNKGFINVYSESGHGSCFKIFLPRHTGKAVDWEEQDNDVIPAGRGSETILVVEDNIDILKITQAMLEKQGYTVIIASSPAESLKLADEYAGSIDLLLTDVIMPQMNGRDLAETMTSRHPDLKVLFMSGYTTNVIANHGVMDEGINFIPKPFSVKGLAAKVRAVLKGEFQQ